MIVLVIVEASWRFTSGSQSNIMSVEAIQSMYQVRKSGNAKMRTRVVEDDSAEPPYERRPKRKRAG